MSSEGEAAETYVEPAHDALVAAWERLAQWKREADDYLSLQRRAAQAALEWERAPAAEKKAFSGTMIHGYPNLSVF